ncbi:MAG: NYN domain-containing protein [Anaerolineaceae bacterium]|nr:MAG: NYN domain-containing protein [Anaerolineaceae bacterium]
MTNDVAIFLDLDNLVIGAKQANLTFDINLVLDHLKQITDGRIVLRQAYGAGRQSQLILQELAQAGFVVQSATRINNFGKNLADMQIVVSAMDTLVDGHQYNTYVLMSGDRDFTPLVQSLRKRGKCVIGVGIKHTTSSSLVELCDQYIFYEDLIPLTDLSQANVEELLALARDDLLQNKKQARASLLKQKMMNLSKGTFDRSAYPESSFRKFLQQYPEIVQLRQEGSTTYIAYPLPSQSEKPLHLRYRSALKKQRVRIIPAHQRFIVLKDLIHLLSEDRQLLWREVLSALAANYKNNSDNGISKNMINAVMLVSRQANVIRTLKGRSLSTAPVLLAIKEGRIFQQAVIRIDGTYLQAIQDLPDPFDLSEATLALYDSTSYMPYLGRVFNSLDALKAN